ncbi:MAG: Rieske 2Fe-2S domain-containing protein [Chloroflexi bacterium]|nr:Rieske 2Fe-2S domain-containing protein [Chloroflexota bacterium]
MLTAEENSILTQVGAGTPGGELLRRYWHPVSVAQELTDEHPTKFVRILKEDLVLFLDKSGRVGLIADKCAHRSASLVYGRVEERGISCAYHGWLYDCEGNIIETPPERNDAIMKNVKIKAYPVEKFVGFYWAYMGPQPAPVLPKFDIFVRKDGKHKITQYPTLDCNWFTAAENGVDSTHLQLLHQKPPFAKVKPADSTRGYIDDIESSDYYETDYGIMKHRSYKGGTEDEHPLVFPAWLRTRGSMWMRTPIDDEHTLHWTLGFRLNEDGAITDEEPEVEYLAPFKDPPDALHPHAKFQNFPKHGWPLSEDVVMWETQGPIPDRSIEHLADSDRGVAMLRKMMFENIAKVKRGEDPLGVVRDPNLVIDTNLEHSIHMEYPTGHVAKTVPV